VTTTPKVEVADLFDRHGRAVRHYFRAATGSAELAEDLAQDGGSVKGRVRSDGRIDVSVDAGRMVMFKGLGGGEGWRGEALSGQRTAIRVTVRRVW